MSKLFRVHTMSALGEVQKGGIHVVVRVNRSGEGER